VTLAGLGRASWSYISCPPEDECRNGHHDCNSAAPKFDECLDTKEAYECVCIANYSKKRGEDRCTPVCKQGKLSRLQLLFWSNYKYVSFV